MLDKVKKLRKTLHRFPELSGEEVETARKIRDFVKEYQPTKIIEGLGGNGLAVVYDFADDGPCIMIRCELDALPILETNTFDHQSTQPGVSHKCGHDGHMAIVAGLSSWLQAKNFPRGKVVLLFQPAEETGKGGPAVLADPRFRALKPDYIFALHNIPGVPLGRIIPLKKQFSATVQSLAISLSGKTAHAAEPENGINPAAAIASLVQTFEKLMIADPLEEDFALLTPVHIHMGQKAYGVSAGQGELHYTIRTWTEERMHQLQTDMKNSIQQICHQHGLRYIIDYFDYFPAARNDEFCNEVVLIAENRIELGLFERSYAFKFGEDFGWFAREYKAAMFGLGAGEDQPALHHADYDFPDELLESGMRIFQEIIVTILNAPTNSGK